MRFKKLMGVVTIIGATFALASCDYNFNLNPTESDVSDTSGLPSNPGWSTVPSTQTNPVVNENNVINIYNNGLKLDVIDISAYSVDKKNDKHALSLKNNKVEFKPGLNGVSIVIRSNLNFQIGSMTLGFNHNSTTVVIEADEDNSKYIAADGYYYSKFDATFDFSEHLEAIDKKISIDGIDIMVNKNKVQIKGELLKGLGIIYDLIPYSVNYYVQGSLYDVRRALQYVELIEAPVIEGREFLGWSKTAGMSDYFNPNYKLTEDISLYAIYRDTTDISEYAKRESCIYYNLFDLGLDSDTSVMTASITEYTEYDTSNNSLYLMSEGVSYYLNEAYFDGKVTVFFDFETERFNVEPIFNLNGINFSLRTDHTGLVKYSSLEVNDTSVSKVGEVLKVGTRYTFRFDIDIDNGELVLSINGKVINRFDVEIAGFFGFEFHSHSGATSPKTFDNLVVCYEKNDSTNKLTPIRNQIRDKIYNAINTLYYSGLDQLIIDDTLEKYNNYLATIAVCDTEQELKTLDEKVQELSTTKRCIVTFKYDFNGTEYTKELKRIVTANEVLLIDHIKIDDYEILGAYYDFERTIPIMGIGTPNDITYYLDVSNKSAHEDILTPEYMTGNWSDGIDYYYDAVGDAMVIKLFNGFPIRYYLDGTTKTAFVELYGRTNGTSKAQDYLKVTAYNSSGVEVGVSYGRTPLDKQNGYFTNNGETTIKIEAYDDIAYLEFACSPEQKSIFINTLKVSYFD